MNCQTCGHENLDEAHFCAACGQSMSAEESQQSDWIGKLVGGRFKVKRVLGEGGMGVVYEGEQQMGSTVRRVAIKTLHAHLSQDSSVLARFHRECGTVAQLMHANTIKFFDFGSEDGTLYIAMEFLDGPSLDKVIEQEGALSPSRTVKILGQICGSLDEAHDQGVIHRDLKPENIVLSERLGDKDFVKVLDFGIAARSESADAAQEAKLTQQGMVLGTPPYMSPEQFTGVELDRRSDVYSLGVMTYEMLTGELPFTANTAWQWATQHMTAQPFPIGDRPTGAAIPNAMRDAVMSALAKEPADRPATAGEFLKRLEEGAAGQLAASISAPTEQMQAAPVFTAPQPSRSGPIGGTDTQSVMSATQPIEVPVTKSKNGVMAAIAVAVIAVAGIGFAMSGGSEGQEGPESAASAVGEEGEPADETKTEAGEDEKPEPTSPEAGEVSPSPSPSPGSTPKPQASPTTSPSPQPQASPTTSPSPQPQASPTTSPSPQPQSQPQPSPEPEPTPAESPSACRSCASLLAQGKWSAVSGVLSQCTAAEQSTCRSKASALAPTQIESAVKDKKCFQALSVMRSASSMGAGVSAALKKKVQNCRK